MKSYIEPAKEIPVYGEYDVIVAGGGTAGMIAGLAAAREGSKTLVIERLNCLGGQFGGMMTTTWTLSDQKKQIVYGIPFELLKAIEEMGGVDNPNYAMDAFINYDSEKAKYMITRLYEKEKNLEVLHLTMVTSAIMEGNKLKGVIIENKSGRQAVFARQFIDCTGDSDLLSFTGGEFEMLEKEKQHPGTLLAKMGNVDVEELKAYYADKPELWKGERYLDGLSHAGNYNFRLHEELEGIELPEEHEYLRDWFILYYSTPNPGEIVLNMSGIVALDGTNARAVSEGENISRKRIFQALAVFRRYIPGFKNAYISATAPALGVRETRRVVGVIKLTAEMIRKGTRFPDAVCCYHAPLFMHTPDGKNITFAQMDPGVTYDIPLRCMLPRKIDGLAVAGRGICVEANAIGSTRNMTPCMCIGQGAGVAAAIAARMGIEIRNVPNDILREALKKQGVYFDGSV